MASFLDERLPKRFWDKCTVDQTSGCWVWLARRLPPWGYGVYYFNGTTRLAHRVAYMTLVGPIGEGLEIDHLCVNPTCCNPAHLEAVTHLENVRRSRSGEHNAIKTHCAQGHAFEGNNIIVRIRRGLECRDCRECHNIANRAYRRRRGMVTA